MQPLVPPHKTPTAQRPRMRMRITSLLEPRFRDALETLLFFNPQQGNWRRRIVASVEKYGSPKLVERQGGLRIELPGAPDSQTLYALAESARTTELAGLLSFDRNGRDELEILHLAVKLEYTNAGGRDQDSVALLLVAELRHIARQVKGIRAVRLPYQRGNEEAD